MSQKLKIVVVGCGGITQVWFPAIARLEGVEVVGLADISLENANKKKEEFHLDQAVVGTDFHEVIAQTRPDVVFDCTLPEVHYEVTLTALKQGCHVLGEKPLADSMDHAREMVATATRQQKLYAVIQNRRFDPRIRRVRRFVQSGCIGSLTTLNCDFYIGAHFGGFRDRMKHVLLLDMAIHTFDAARYLSGSDPVSVYCHEWNPQGSWYDHDASAVAIFEMTNGIVYTYRGSWCAEGVNTTWESDWRLVGTRGSAHWDGGDGFTAQSVTDTSGFLSTLADQPLPPLDPSDKIDGHAGQIQDFIDCVRTGRTPETICTDNIRSLAMVFAAIESAESKKAVKISW